jgi:hypothetical protein
MYIHVHTYTNLRFAMPQKVDGFESSRPNDIVTAQDAEGDRPALPSPLETPKAYPGCCLALSLPLLTYLAATLPLPPHLVLSIGSGYGLLEALLLQPPHRVHIVGIEVQPSSNRFLPPDHHIPVNGSRFLEPLAAKATAWLFVYPKRVGLMQEYINTYGNDAVNQIIWMGPKADWRDYKGCFDVPDATLGTSSWNVKTQSAAEVGGTSWEMIAVAQKE